MNKIIEEYSKMVNLQNELSRKGNKEKIVILLGAGFSIDQGYPKASDVAKKLTRLSANQFSLSSEGILYENNGAKSGSSSQDSIFQRTLLFLIDLIKLYCNHLKSEDNFNYEELYDLINIGQYHRFVDYNPSFDIFNEECKLIANKYSTEFITYDQLLRRVPIVYSQLIGTVIKGKGMTSPFYGDVHTTIDSYPQYSNFLRFLKKESLFNIIDVFTLNHDLFFESFKNIQELQDNEHCSLISDGFDDYGSEYFGVVKSRDNFYKCRLERYTGRYNTPIRLYKLHGSFDYVLCYKTIKTPQGNYARPLKYVKSKNGIMPFEFYKSDRSKMKYEFCLTNYCESFLSGTKSKIIQYADRLLYSKLFKRFKNSLRNADKLIIIGYSGSDKEINRYLLNYFDSSKGRCTIIDYAPGEKLKIFAKKINANILVGKIEEQIVNVE